LSFHNPNLPPKHRLRVNQTDYLIGLGLVSLFVPLPFLRVLLALVIAFVLMIVTSPN